MTPRGEAFDELLARAVLRWEDLLGQRFTPIEHEDAFQIARRLYERAPLQMEAKEAMDRAARFAVLIMLQMSNPGNGGSKEGHGK